MLIDDNGMVILHRDFIEDQPDDLNTISNVHIVTKVTKGIKYTVIFAVYIYVKLQTTVYPSKFL